MNSAKATSKPPLSNVELDPKLLDPAAIFNSYFEAMGTSSRKLVCTVTMAKSGFHPDIVKLDVALLKESISFKYSNGAYGYRDATHILSCQDMEYRLSCANNGEVRLYTMSAEGDASFYGAFDGVHQIMDPMFAFAYMGNVYIVFNAPDDATIARGTRGRAPKLSDGKLVAKATGRVVIVRFDGSGSALLNPSLGSDNGYFAALVGDQSGMPMVLCANMHRDAYVVDLPVSFRDLVSNLFKKDETIDDNVVSSIFPLGISVKRFSDDAAWHLVPLTGDDGYGVKSIEFAESDENADKLKIMFDPS